MNWSYERDLHPYYRKQGEVRALETIRFSVSTHRGCYGECSFCAIAVHQGRTVQWRSQASVLAEVKEMAAHPAFKGIISDVGGPTANMYGFECRKKQLKGACSDKRCLHPGICDQLKVDHRHQIDLLKAIREIKAVRHVFVASGIRYDLILSDRKNGQRYLTDVVHHHTSGQMKIAPEHTENDVLDLMGKPGMDSLIEFKHLFDAICKTSGKQLYLTYYFMAAHPGCTEAHMSRLKTFVSRHLRLIPEQVQVFTPTPSTVSTLVYHTGVHPASGAPVFCEKQAQEERKAKTNAAETIMSLPFAFSISGFHAQPIELNETFMETASRFAALPGTVLLMSGTGLDCARYHILGVKPWLALTGRDQRLQVRIHDTVHHIAENPFEVLRQILRQFHFNAASSDFEMPIGAGLMGYLAYDLKDCLEKLPRTSVDDLGLPHICLYAPSVILVQDAVSRKSWICAPIFTGVRRIDSF